MTPLPTHVAAIDGRTVLVLAADGAPVSIGRVSVKAMHHDSRTSPVSIRFETEALRCEFGVPSEKIDALTQSSAGEHLAYRLPIGDAFGVEKPAQRADIVTAPIIETFPLPDRAILAAAPQLHLPPKPPAASASEKLQKTGAAVDKLMRAAAPPAPASR